MTTNNTRTMAFQISEELFLRIKAHLERETARTGRKLTQKEFVLRPYYNGGSLALLLVDWTSGEPENWGALTVNFGAGTAKDCAFVDVNNLGESILPWIEQSGLGKPTGRRECSGFVEYPEYRFDAKRLQELDDYGYQE